MNIIKFKDTVITDTNKLEFQWYNENLRGKYAYWVRCHYVIPLNSISQNMYVSFETTINNLLEYDYYVLNLVDDEYKYVFVPINDVSENQSNRSVVVEEVPANPTAESNLYIKIDNSRIKYVDLWQGDYYWMNSYIDNVETDKVNSVDFYRQSNNYVPSDNISLDELKRFRTWLSTSLLDMNYSFYGWVDNSYLLIENPTLEQRQSAVSVDELPSTETYSIIKIKNLSIVDWTDDQNHILEYYKNNMYDDTLKWISIYGGMNTSLSINDKVSGCGCGTGTNISSLYNSGVSVCDVPYIYKNGLKIGMVELFSNINTWTQLPSTYLLTVKKYIDGIIQANLGLVYDESSNYYDCECLNKNNQDNGMSVLRQLSSAFEYLSDQEILPNHKNFVLTTLNKWASNLYEIMEWN